MALTCSVAWAHGDESHNSDDKHENVPENASNNAQAHIVITDGWVTAGPNVIKLKRGDQVRLTFISNAEDELHLHGYDIAIPLEPNKLAVLAFEAKYPGRFGYELHKAHREIGALEIYP